jgi:hypothetical protein
VLDEAGRLTDWEYKGMGVLDHAIAGRLSDRERPVSTWPWDLVLAENKSSPGDEPKRSTDFVSGRWITQWTAPGETCNFSFPDQVARSLGSGGSTTRR